MAGGWFLGGTILIVQVVQNRKFPALTDPAVNADFMLLK